MKIIVCGAGQVGLQIAKHLSGERMDVIVIDKSSELIKKFLLSIIMSPALILYPSKKLILLRVN